MEGICLKFYVSEAQRHAGLCMHDWLLKTGKALGVRGGTAVRAIAGFGRHGHLHEETFFELAGDLPIEVSFLLDEAQCSALLAQVSRESLRLFYVRHPTEYGVTGA